jgi:YHS domain-containing protein
MFKDPICKMMVDEKTAKNVSEVDGRKSTFALPCVKKNSTRTRVNNGY